MLLRKKNFNLFIIGFLSWILIILFINCSHSKKDSIVENFIKTYVLNLLSSSSSDYYSRMYYFSPNLFFSSTNSNLVVEATSQNVTAGKMKLILIHGWDPSDRESMASVSDSELKKRILNNNWIEFVTTDAFFQITNTKNYDVYAYDYNSALPIDENGKKLRSKMDSLFSNESGTVVILGYSMGGLVTRFAIYEGSRPAYIARVIASGVPFHGSPWASPSYQKSTSALGDLASFLTNTAGGKDLAWDNFDNSLSGASNAKLTAINNKKDRDDLFYAYYSSASSTLASDSGKQLLASCLIFDNDKISPSDCIVPATSAYLKGNTFSKTTDVGKYDHFDMKLRVSSVRINLLSDLP